MGWRPMEPRELFRRDEEPSTRALTTMVITDDTPIIQILEQSKP